MKRISKKITWFFGVAALLVTSLGICSFKKGSCATSAMSSEAIDQLKKFTLVDQFPFYMKKHKGGDVEYKKQIITLNRGVRYKFYTIRNTEYDGMPILSIYNNEKQEFLLGSTYNSTFKRFYNELEFECKTTGNYCLSFSFLDGVEGCALGIFASLVKE